MLNPDIISHICKYLDEKDVITFHKITKFASKLKGRWVHLSSFNNLIYFVDYLHSNRIIIDRDELLFYGSYQQRRALLHTSICKKKEILRKLIAREREGDIFIISGSNEHINIYIIYQHVIVNIIYVRSSLMYNVNSMIEPVESTDWYNIKSKILKNKKINDINVALAINYANFQCIGATLRFENNYMIIENGENHDCDCYNIAEFIVYFDISKNKKFVCDVIDLFIGLNTREIY
jgi:hypothetical protein